MTEPEARVAADECIKQTERAMQASKLDTNASDRPCSDGRTIFFPGRGYALTSQHDFNAIFGRSTRPDPVHPHNNISNMAWIQLNWVNVADRKALPARLAKGWYAPDYPCNSSFTGAAAGKDCDEFPFYAPAESGEGASLQAIESEDNRPAGVLYGGFAKAFGLILGGLAPEPKNPLGSPFSVIPLVDSGAPPTFEICSRT